MPRLLPSAIALLVLLPAPLGMPARADAPPADAISLAGIRRIAAPGVPGPLAVTGDATQVLATDPDGLPVAAATEWKTGRIVVFGHGGYLHARAVGQHDTGVLLRRAIAWCGRAATPSVAAGDARIAKALAAIDVEARVSPTLAARGARRKDIPPIAADVLVVDSHRLGASAITLLRKHVARGGGVVTAGLGWGWQQLNPDRDLRTEHPGNTLLSETGIQFAPGTLARAGDAGYAMTPHRLLLANARRAFEALVLHEEGRRALGLADGEQAARVVMAALPTGPLFGGGLAADFRALARDRRGTIIPTDAHPLGRRSPLERVLLAEEVRDLVAAAGAGAPAAAHPAAQEFPGAVPFDAAPRPVRVRICGAPPGVPRVGPFAQASRAIWHSTGTYAAPGATIRVRVLGDKVPDGLRVQIGCHTDDISRHRHWKRLPRLVVSRPVSRKGTKLVSPFGGLVYLTVPPKAIGQPACELVVEGGVPAPRFVLGETTPAAWRDGIRDAPGPWAELATDRVVLTLPSAAIRTLDDPTAVLRLWNRVLDACADLGRGDRRRQAPERIVVDVQISNGYMHSGYPIMAHLDAIPPLWDVERLRQGNWGLFHELGHNHQRRAWHFDGTTEVGCNLFTQYVFETVCDRPPRAARKGWPPDVSAHIDDKADFATWKTKPFLALATFWMVQDAFGWAPFQKVLHGFHAAPDAAGAVPSDAARRSRLVARLSRATGRNLVPHFRRFGVPIDEDVAASLADLPAWQAPLLPAPAR